MSRVSKKSPKRLGELLSTAICSNDILSSSLYVCGIAIIFSGVYAPLVLVMVAVVLYFYRAVYREVVEALPVNGGTYNALLNATTKTIAAVAGIMTILSYVATCVISAKTAVEYLLAFFVSLSLHNSWLITPEVIKSLVIPVVLVVLAFFALLVVTGIKDSARISLGIFLFHLFTLVSFIILGVIFVFNNGFQILIDNLSYTSNIISSNGGLATTIFLGFSASLLGISGFETSADFVEEQEKGVFKKTLKNMFYGVLILNPLIALIILTILPFNDITLAKDSILAMGAFKEGGFLLAGWISINAFLVLCGAVLTSFIGVSGLVNRMSLDECLPVSLNKPNKKGAHPRIVFVFFILCSSVLLITGGNLFSLAGFYAISFLIVMTLFALANLILRNTRKDLKRNYSAPFIFVVFAALGTLIGILGNLLIDKSNFVYFLYYFIPTFTLVILLLYKREVFKFLFKLTHGIPPLRHYFYRKYYLIISGKVYVFIHHSTNLYRILRYIDINENGCNVMLIHCADGDRGEKEKIQKALPTLKEVGAFADFNVSFHYLNIPFGPEAIEELSKQFKIRKNKIFIGSIHHTHDFDYEELGGVRIIS